MAAAIADKSAVVVQVAQSSITINKPSTVADGDLLVAVVTDQSSTQSTDYSCAGWTRVGPAFVASSAVNRVTDMFYKAVPSAAAESATTYTFTGVASGGRQIGIIYRLTGVNLSSPVNAASSGYGTAAGTTTAFTAPAATGPGLMVSVLQAQWASPNADNLVSISPAVTQQDYTLNPVGATTAVSRTRQGVFTNYVAGSKSATGETITYGGAAAQSASFAVLFADAVGLITGTVAVSETVTVATAASVSATTTGDVATTFGTTTSAAVSGSGASLAVAETFGSSTTPVVSAASSIAVPFTAAVSTVATKGNSTGVPVAAVFGVVTTLAPHTLTPVEQWMNAAPTYTAHRGGSVSWVEETADAYAHSAAWNPNLALEFSMWQTSDGIWVGSHDQNTSRMFGTSVDIPTNTYATLAPLRTTVGGFPIFKLTDFLALYGGKRILVLDNKGGQNQAALLTLLSSYGGASWNILKTYAPGGNSITGTGRSAGYKVWGYYFDADTPNLASTHANFDILGEDYNATQATWTQVMSYGQPTWAHILNNAAARTTSDSKASTATGGMVPLAGYMASDVVDVVPAIFSAAANVASSFSVVSTATVSAAPASAAVGETFAVSSAANVGASGSASIPTTFSATTAGQVNRSASSALAETFTSATAASVSTSGSSAVPQTVTVVSAGAVAASSGSQVVSSFAVATTASVTAVGTGNSSVNVTVGIATTGAVVVRSTVAVPETWASSTSAVVPFTDTVSTVGFFGVVTSAVVSASASAPVSTALTTVTTASVAAAPVSVARAQVFGVATGAAVSALFSGSVLSTVSILTSAVVGGAFRDISFTVEGPLGNPLAVSEPLGNLLTMSKPFGNLLSMTRPEN